MKKTYIWLAALAGLHFMLACWYATVTPFRVSGRIVMTGAVSKDISAPDERQHVNYVDHVAQGKGFPVFTTDPNSPVLYETYQSHQPPLFYLLEAGWSKLVGISDVTQAGSGVRLRLLNCLIGMLGVFGVGFLALWTTKNELTARIAAGMACLLPMNLALSGAVSNDPLLITLCTWCLALCALVVREGWSIERLIGIALLTVAALYTKTTAMALLPIVLLAAYFAPGQMKVMRRVLNGFMLLALIVLLALPWWIRNNQLYGDPFAMNAFNRAFVGSMQAEQMTQIAGGTFAYWSTKVGLGTLCSFFGVFGYWDIWLPIQVYMLLALTAAGMSIGWVLYLKTDRESQKVHWMNGIFLFIVTALFIRFNMQYFQAQGRYLLPAIGVIMTGLACGLTYFAQKRGPLVALSLGILMCILNLVILSNLPYEFEKRTNPPETSVN